MKWKNSIVKQPKKHTRQCLRCSNWDWLDRKPCGILPDFASFRCSQRVLKKSAPSVNGSETAGTCLAASAKICFPTGSVVYASRAEQPSNCPIWSGNGGCRRLPRNPVTPHFVRPLLKKECVQHNLLESFKEEAAAPAPPGTGRGSDRGTEPGADSGPRLGSVRKAFGRKAFGRSSGIGANGRLAVLKSAAVLPRSRETGAGTGAGTKEPLYGFVVQFVR